MLKGIPPILSPELLKILAEMGHGDEIVIVDGNFPAARLARHLVRSDAHGVAEILDAVLRFFPLDTFVERPVTLMSVVPEDDYVPLAWQRYREIITSHDRTFSDFGFLDRHVFYERAARAYAVVATSDMARYANLILTKGLVNPD
jgi:L-fucose mutarotase